MARQQSVTLIDDIDGGRAVETVRFGIDGVSYEIDLSKRNANALRKSLGGFVDHARRVRATRTVSRSARVNKAAVSPAEVRLWARVNGVPLSARGRNPALVMAQFTEAAS